ncbi:hypothetical protein MHK_010608 [Candidatus Magnetomorum sp. HK-1]|nr:hypothetical protein MHK_010608 [Candidatus Magnetomorum sp. HK-1]
MEAIRKIQKVNDGIINFRLPRRFWGHQIEIIVLTIPQKETQLKQKSSLRGCLHNYADPALIPLEKNAWQNSVGEKYENH